MRVHPLPGSTLIGATMVQLDVNFVSTWFKITTFSQGVRDVEGTEKLWSSAVETRLL